MPGRPEDPKRPIRARMDALFEEMLRVDPEARIAWLARQDIEDPEIRRGVLDLLSKTETVTQGVEPTARSSLLMRRQTFAAEEDSAVGTVIGAWRVLAELGRGGMGTVYRAERADGAFEQEAALKLIRSDAWNPDVGRRFEVERQILAKLDHPNIARLLDGGEVGDGRPYLVMELVEGQSIDAYCDRRRLTLAQRLELFEQVCRAVRHAHRSLFVHRDIKPSNVIVSPGGKVKLVDFGIARALDSALVSSLPNSEPLTRAMDWIMTPSYASPEQISGQAITTATDVYQLGLLLFEMMVGRKAQKADGLSPIHLVRLVCEAEIEPPSAAALNVDKEVADNRRSAPAELSKELLGDLDAMIGMALHKEPERRYDSAQQLLEDIGRHRAGLPVLARPDTLIYRTSRFVARHRRAMGLGSLGFLLISALLGLSLDSRLKADQERARTLEATTRAQQYVAVISELFEYPLRSDGDGPPRMRDFADRAVTIIRRDLKDQPLARAGLLAEIGPTYSSIGAYEQAVEVFIEALEAITEDQIKRSDLLLQLGRNQHFFGDFDGAEASLREAVSLLRSIHGPHALRVAKVELEIADLLHSRGRLSAAHAMFEATIARLESVEPEPPPALISEAYGFFGNVLRDRGLYESAELAYQKGLAKRDELDDGPGTKFALRSVQYARLLTLQGRFDEAEARFGSELKKLRLVHFDDHPLSAVTLRELAFLQVSRGQPDQAANSLAEAIRISEGWLKPRHPTLPRLHAIDAEIKRRQGSSIQALQAAKAALDSFKEIGLKGHPYALDACVTLVKVVDEPGMSAQPWMAPHLEDCRASAEAELDPENPRIRWLQESIE